MRSGPSTLDVWNHESKFWSFLPMPQKILWMRFCFWRSSRFRPALSPPTSCKPPSVPPGVGAPVGSTRSPALVSCRIPLRWENGRLTRPLPRATAAVHGAQPISGSCRQRWKVLGNCRKGKSRSSKLSKLFPALSGQAMSPRPSPTVG